MPEPFEIEIVDADVWRRKTKGVFLKPLKALLNEAGELGADTAARGLDSLVAGPSIRAQVGRLRSGNFVDSKSLMAQNSPDAVRVYSLMSNARVESIEAGRPQGERVHTNRLVRWARRVGYAHNLFFLAEQIRRRGVKGRFFMKAARDKVAERLPSLVSKMASGTVKEFSRRR